MSRPPSAAGSAPGTPTPRTAASGGTTPIHTIVQNLPNLFQMYEKGTLSDTQVTQVSFFPFFGLLVIRTRGRQGRMGDARITTICQQDLFTTGSLTFSPLCSSATNPHAYPHSTNNSQRFIFRPFQPSLLSPRRDQPLVTMEDPTGAHFA